MTLESQSYLQMIPDETLRTLDPYEQVFYDIECPVCFALVCTWPGCKDEGHEHGPHGSHAHLYVPTILELEAKANEHGLTVYDIHHCRAGWGVTWFDCNEDVGPDYETVTQDIGDGSTFNIERATNNYKRALAIYDYYPTPDEMLRAEMKRLEALPNALENSTSE